MFKTKVKDIMTKQVITADKNTNFFDVAQLMKKHDTGFIPIMEEKRVIGVITDRDMVIRGIANKEDSNTPIGKYITQEIIAVKPDTSIDIASHIMADKQVKRLLVIDDNELVGVLSLSDITNHNQKEALQALTGINRKHKKNYFEDNPEVDDFKL
ncbi:MAG: CBS domain-containing protein [Bacilli bacterium]|jgi:CBS domain-containing protein